MTLPIQLHPECTPNWLSEATDAELLMQARIELLESTLNEVRRLLNIPPRPAEIDELYHAGRAGLLAGRMQMAANLIDSPVIALEAEQPCD
jgi:hypothetical protein